MRRVYSARYTQMGGSMGVLIPRDLREQLQLEVGDLMLITRYGPLLIMRKATPATVFEKDAIPTAALPPTVPPGGPRG